MKPTYHRWFWLMLAGFLTAACNFPGGATPTDLMAEVRTAAALTVQAMSTQAAPTQTAPALPTLTPPPAASASATPNPDLPCNWPSLCPKDVPDGSQFFPGSVFVKSWTLRNAGAVFGRQLTSSSTSPAISRTSFRSRNSPTARLRRGKRWSSCSVSRCRKIRGITAADFLPAGR